MVESKKDSKLNKVPELPIIPAFLTLVLLGLTIIISPETIWKYSLEIKSVLVKSKL